MLSVLQYGYQQIPLIHIVHDDDLVLLDAPDAAWFKVLYYFPWKDYQIYGAQYYDALYEFNIREAKKRQERLSEREDQIGETQEQAKQRLLFARVTMQKYQEATNPSIIYEGEVPDESELPKIEPESIFPGVVPNRLGGRKPKCFFALLKSFLGATLMGFAPEPEHVHLLLNSNPSFVRVCGFAPKNEKDEYCFMHVPSIRKLEQFDQIMTEWGIWQSLKLQEVRGNIESGVIKKEDELVADTTHYYAYSGFETVKYIDDKGKEQKKSQSKPTKNCRCENRETCEHPWVLADDGAGTVVKSNNKMYWAHKASIIGFPRQGVPLDAVTISDASTFDGETLYPHVEKLFDDLPEIKSSTKRILYDSACDNKELKDKLLNDFGIKLKASLNPRRKKEVTENLPRGIEKITPYRVPICRAGHEMEYKGMRCENEKFIYQDPRDSDNYAVCLTCQYKENCCPDSFITGRVINISFDLLPHIDTDDPPMAKRFKAIMGRRPSVERMIKRLKCDLSDDRLTKRGNVSFQAYLDKTLIAYHILLRF